MRYKEAKDLTPEDSLMPGYFKLSPIKGNTELKDYLMIKDNINDRKNKVKKWARKLGVVLLLKGNVDVISDGKIRFSDIDSVIAAVIY